MAIARLEFDGVEYSGYREIAEKNKDVNRHSLEINAGKAHAKQGGSEINFRYKGHAVRIVYRGRSSAVWPIGVDNCTAPLKKAIETAKKIKAPFEGRAELAPTDSELAVLRSRVCELEKAQIRTAARLKAVENANFALRKIVAEIQGE